MFMMDEATSAMDTITQKKAADGIAEEQKRLGFSVVQVAHRIETLSKSDVLYFVDHGKVVEVGGNKSLKGKAIEELIARDIQYTSFLNPETGLMEERVSSGFYRHLHEAYYNLDFHAMSMTELIQKVRQLKLQLARAEDEKNARMVPLLAKLPPMLELEFSRTEPAPRLDSAPTSMVNKIMAPCSPNFPMQIDECNIDEQPKFEKFELERSSTHK